MEQKQQEEVFFQVLILNWRERRMEISRSEEKDMDMVSEVYLNTLKKSLDEGRISINDINKACRRILVAKYRLGLFDDPYRFCHSADEVSRELYSDANRAAARRIAGETLVLLV